MSTLDPVQLAASDFARDKRGVGWFMEQGLGKTLCALAEFSLVSAPRRGRPHDRDRPQHLQEGVGRRDREARLQLRLPRLPVVEDGASADNFLRRLRHNAPPVLIVNYEAIRSPDVLEAVRTWARRGQDLSGDRRVASRSRAIARRRPRRSTSSRRSAASRILTGRPQTQGPQDLWGQLRAIGLLPRHQLLRLPRPLLRHGRLHDEGVVGVRRTDRARGADGAVCLPGEEERLVARIAAQGRDHP